MSRFQFACVSLFAMLFAAPARAGVLVVDALNGPGTNFVALQDAIDAAVDGDTLLIRQGGYFSFTIDGKSLVLSADAGAFVTCFDLPFANPPGCQVKNVPAGKSIAIRGLTMYGLILRNNAGAVRLDDCHLISRFAAADVAQSSAVSFTNCALEGSNGLNTAYGGSPAGTGLLSVDSRIHLDHCTATGGNGGDAFVEIATNLVASASAAGSGAKVQGGELFASATSFRGGDGADGLNLSLWCLPPTDGGNGLNVTSGAVVYAHGCTFNGGLGATGCQFFTNVNSAPGVPTSTSSGGSLTILSGPTRTFAAPSPTRELQVSNLLIGGVPGDVPLLFASTGQGFSIFPFARGTLLVGSPTLAIALAPLPPSGFATVPVTVPDLGPGVLGIQTYVQSAFCPSGAPCLLGPSSTFLMLDQSL